MVVADQIVDSSITNNNSNNDREVDGDFKRVNEVLESSKACVRTQPFFSIKSFPGSSNLHTTQNVHPKTKQLQKRLLVKNKKIEKRRPTSA